MKDSGVGSFAYAHRHELPGEPMRFEKTAPKARPAFEYNRDPYVAKQMADQGKSEAERRGSFMGQWGRIAPPLTGNGMMSLWPRGAASGVRTANTSISRRLHQSR